MNRILLGILLFCLGTVVNAQVSPVQFHFTAERVHDSLVIFTAKGYIEKKLQLFSVKNDRNNPFTSIITFDTALHSYRQPGDSMAETGTVLQDSVNNAHFFQDSVAFTVPFHISKKENNIKIKGAISWLGKKEDTYPSGEQAFNITIEEKKSPGNLAETNNKEQQESLSALSLFAFCFLAGLAAVFTPCVFPLIPVTVSFFLKKSKTRKVGIKNAWIYSLSIILIYTVPSVILTLILGDGFLYRISTHPVSNLLFFFLFTLFAIAFFGAFELTLPSSWATRADAGSGKGGIIGIFFMALTLVIVSFSCTGPIVASLLSQTSGQGLSMGAVIGMAGFGTGIAIPFGLFALFPSLLQSLPKSGSWLNTVKVSFGFIELALAMKFLSNVDLAYHWHLLNRDVFLVIWIIIFILLGLYLLGKIKFSHDSDFSYLSVPRLFTAIASLCFALYLIPGLWGAPLKPLSGILPPLATQDFNLNDLKYTIQNTTKEHSALQENTNAIAPKKYADIFHVPFGLKAYYDMDEAMAASNVLKKPIMIDFTGWSCANCRKMENEVWSDPRVLKTLKEDFILVSLYVDDKTELPETEKITAPDGTTIHTIGEKNLYYEQTTFHLNAQPLYKFVDDKGNTLSDVQYGYDPNIDKFLKHLEAVKTTFRKRNP